MDSDRGHLSRILIHNLIFSTMDLKAWSLNQPYQHHWEIVRNADFENLPKPMESEILMVELAMSLSSSDTP